MGRGSSRRQMFKEYYPAGDGSAAHGDYNAAAAAPVTQIREVTREIAHLVRTSHALPRNAPSVRVCVWGVEAEVTIGVDA